MKIHLKAGLSINSDRRAFGGTIPTVFRKEMDIEMTPDILQLIMKYYVILLEGEINCRIYDYRIVDGVMTMIVMGQMKLSDSTYVALLKENGWSLDEEAARHYNLV